MVASGLGWTDFGRQDVVSGLVRHFYQLVADHYGAALFSLKGPEPHVAEAIFGRMADEAGVSWAPGTGLGSVEGSRGQITGVRAGPGMGLFEAAVFVDASYEGDLMAGAGVPYRVGREGRSLHGERWAGRQPAYRPGMHNFPVLVAPFAQPEGGGLLPEIRPPALDGRGWPEEALGEGDGALQAYQLRLCLTDRAEGQLPLDEPPGYDPARFEVLRRYLRATGGTVPAGHLLGIVSDLLPNGKCDVNSIGPFSLNVLSGANLAYPEGSPATRAAIYEHHRRFSYELLWFLRADDDVPWAVRDEVGRWSLCADEFVDNGGWPHQLYVREARRMVGRYVLTEHDLFGAGGGGAEVGAEGVAVATGSYNIDIREIERTWRYLPEYHAQAAVFNEGYLSLQVPPYPIPYGCLLAPEGEADNLLVPVCCSASHIAFGSVRTEPTLMALGEVAGRAAAWAARALTPLSRLSPEVLRTD
jgi:hypothetical protein